MHIFPEKRRLLSAAACVLTACAIFYLVNHPAIVGATASRRQLPIYSVQSDYKTVALSGVM